MVVGPWKGGGPVAVALALLALRKGKGSEGREGREAPLRRGCRWCKLACEPAKFWREVAPHALLGLIEGGNGNALLLLAAESMAAEREEGKPERVEVAEAMLAVWE